MNWKQILGNKNIIAGRNSVLSHQKGKKKKR